MTDHAGELPANMGSVKCRRATAKAILVIMRNGDEVWIPQKAVHDDSDVWRAGDVGRLVVKSWFARIRGWGIGT